MNIINFTQLRKDVINGLNAYITPIKTIMNDQNSPKPAYPFIGLKFTTPFNPEGNFAIDTGQAVASTNPNFEHDFLYTREEQPTMTLSITAYSKTLDEAENKAMQAYQWFKFNGYNYLKSKGLIVVECTTVDDRDTLIVDDYERRKGFDVIFRVSSTLTNRIETIEAVETERV